MSEQLTAHMTLVSVLALTGIVLMYHGVVAGTSRHWPWGVALVMGSVVHGVVMRRRAMALLVGHFVHEGYDIRLAKARAKLEMDNLTLGGAERTGP